MHIAKLTSEIRTHSELKTPEEEFMEAMSKRQAKIMYRVSYASICSHPLNCTEVHLVNVYTRGLAVFAFCND